MLGNSYRPGAAVPGVSEYFMIQLLKNMCIKHLSVWVSINLAAPGELREDISKKDISGLQESVSNKPILQRGKGLWWRLLLLPVRHGAASLSAAINSQHRLFKGKTALCMSPGYEPGCAAEGKSFWERNWLQGARLCEERLWQLWF